MRRPETCRYALFKHTGRPICSLEAKYCHQVRYCEVEEEEERDKYFEYQEVQWEEDHGLI